MRRVRQESTVGKVTRSTRPSIFVGDRVAPAEVWPGRVPPVVALSQVTATNGFGMIVDHGAVLPATGHCYSENRCHLNAIRISLSVPRLGKRMLLALYGHHLLEINNMGASGVHHCSMYAVGTRNGVQSRRITSGTCSEIAVPRVEFGHEANREHFNTIDFLCERARDESSFAINLRNVSA